MAAPKSPLARSEKIWFDGDLIPWDQAQVHVLSHVLHYGSSVFEGIRCYNGKNGPQVFRLAEHIDRLYFSAKVIRMDIPYTPAEFAKACRDTIAINELDECYLRPVVFRGAGAMGVLPKNCPTHCAVAVWPWGAYLGDEALTEGIDIMISTWTKMAPNTIPSMAKIGGAYVLSTLAKMEAVRQGYAEAILLDTNGRVSEGSGENVFAVFDGQLVTTPLSNSILGGITRDTVIALAADRGMEVKEQTLSREALYLADELFFTGTAAEITPIRSIDRLEVGTGRPGPVTLSLQEHFFDILRGKKPDRHGWLTPVAPASIVAD